MVQELAVTNFTRDLGQSKPTLLYQLQGKIPSLSILFKLKLLRIHIQLDVQMQCTECQVTCNSWLQGCVLYTT